MKQIHLFIPVCLICIFFFSACSSGNDSSINDSSHQDNITEINYAAMMPSNSIFKSGKFDIIDPDGGEMYAFSVTDYTDEEFTEYISQCKEIGFNDIVYELDSRFGAYTTDGEYWIQLSKEDNGSLTIICNTSKNK
ncbi:MAG TPA: hypothetical protein IAD34_09275 [Candidatus Scatovicinus merdipullorum]|nr:hypothetical protein [Candidatus Scatovicinus merdipullorum]